jgi:hypothetical protein
MNKTFSQLLNNPNFRCPTDCGGGGRRRSPTDCGGGGRRSPTDCGGGGR